MPNTFTDPNVIAQQQALARMLLGQIGQGPQTSALSPLAGLAQGLASGFHGAMAMRNLNRNQELRSNILSQFLSGGQDPSVLLGSQDPELQNLGLSLLPRPVSDLERRKTQAEINNLETPADVRTLQFLQGGQSGGVDASGFIADKFKSNAEKEREKVRARSEEENAADLRGKAQGARNFLTKVKRVEDFIRNNPASADLFGPIQGSEANRFLGSAFGTTAERQRTQLKAMLRDLELDVARFKLKGQGQVTEAERAIARDTLPQLTNPDPESALAIIQGLKAEANDLIGQGGEPVPIPVPTFNVTPQGQVTPAQPPINAQTAPPVPGATQLDVGPGADPRGALFPQQQSGTPQIPATIAKVRQAMQFGASLQEIQQALIIDGTPPEIVQQIMSALAQGPGAQ